MKHIAIIGGGISGLTVLHYLKQRLGDNVRITLFEREALTGGTIRSFKNGSCLFEWGPNGFLDDQPATLQLIEELGLTDQLMTASPAARKRYIQIKNKLIVLPGGPLGFMATPLLPAKDKRSLISGMFKKNISKDCSIYDYISKRFSSSVAESLVDPFISGIYAGNIRRLHMASAFPKLKRKGFKASRMRTFKGGMGQIIESLDNRYKKHIQTNAGTQDLAALQRSADITIIATPAYAAARIVENTNPVLAQILDQIPYAPIAVAGLLFKRDSFKKVPDGFGYLIASKEKKDILGVLIESNVYAQRTEGDQILTRVMLGGAHHPQIINDTEKQVLAKAIKEIDSTYGIRSQPIKTFMKIWPKAIPQYEINYPYWRQSVAEQCAKTLGLYLCANYLDGVSFNDCIANARSLAGRVQV
jgi:oxygen-dependent protoporphyrinogen oxidase